MYLAEKRSFGGSLDDGQTRLEYYHQVLGNDSLRGCRLSSPRNQTTGTSLWRISPNDRGAFRNRVHARWAVPEENQSLLVAPAPDSGEFNVWLPTGNFYGTVRNTKHTTFKVIHIGELLKICREELLQKAISYTRSYRDVARSECNQMHPPLPIIRRRATSLIFSILVFGQKILLSIAGREKIVELASRFSLIDADVPKSLGIECTGRESLQDPRLKCILSLIVDAKIEFPTKLGRFKTYRSISGLW